MMAARLRTWWQKIQQHPVGSAVIIVLGIALLVAFIGGYYFNWNWTGFNSYIGQQLKPFQPYRPEKTLWDWLQLLIIPLVLAVAALLFNLASSRTEQKVALDKQRQDLLQVYLDRMAELLLEKQLGTSAPEAVRNVARVRTITVLTQLDARRVGYVFAFLREAGLMSTTSNDNVVSLDGADLRRVDWSHAYLWEVNLSGANISEDILFRTDLRSANLSNTILSGANLRGADLSGAHLWGTKLIDVNLSGANLRRASINDVDLSGADLSGANLIKADIIEEELNLARSLKGVTMPNRSKHP